MDIGDSLSRVSYLFDLVLLSQIVMATAYKGNDDFEKEIQSVRDSIQSKFVKYVQCLRVRESELLKRLDEVLTSYNSYKNRIPQTDEEILYSDSTHSTVDDKQTQPNMVRFVCSDKILSELNRLGELVERVVEVTDYRSKIRPQVSVCNLGKGIDQLYRPHGVTVDRKSGIIYVADCFNSCVKVFDGAGSYMFHFGDTRGAGQMRWPRSLVLCDDRILVSQGDVLSQSTHKIFSYYLDGSYISKVGKLGTRELSFKLPTGMTYDEFSGQVYICDSGNNRIQILTKELSFISQFGEDSLSSPRDVKLSLDHIIVLDESNYCLHLFSYDYVLQKSVITRNTGTQEIDPFYFFIDRFDNILVSDYNYNSVLIYNSQFQFIHRISVSTSPMGIAVDQDGRVIIACQARSQCLQIF